MISSSKLNSCDEILNHDTNVLSVCKIVISLDYSFYNLYVQYSVTGKEWGHLLIEPEFKPIFVNSYINWNGFIIFVLIRI